MNEAYVINGALGDICSGLPLLYADHLAGKRSTLVVSAQYQDLLDGVSYCDRMVYPGHYSESRKAVEMAVNSGRFSRVRSVQMYGSGSPRRTESFQKDGYALAGRLDEFWKYPLVFDRRDTGREQELANSHASSKPILLLSTEGRSSPFEHRQLLKQHVRDTWGSRFHIMDLDKIRAVRFYDLLGLYDRAAGLIAIDSGPLHLARASTVPTVALLTDKPDKWHSAIPPDQTLLKLFYSEYPSKVALMDQAIEKMAPKPPQIAPKPPGRALVHVYSHFPGTGDTKRRNDMAARTWTLEYAKGPWKPCPIYDRDLKRNSKSVGDDRAGVPFINDMLDIGAEKASDDDLLVLTNTDTCFSVGLTEAILEEMKNNRPIAAHRYDFARIDRQMTPMEALMGDWYCGNDLFCFTKKWWMEHRGEYPPMLHACEAWDLVMREVVMKYGGVAWHGGHLSHERHSSWWYSPGVKNSHPVQKFNVKNAKAWLAKNKGPKHELSGR